MASMYAHYRFYSSSEVPLDLKLHVTSLDCKHLARTAALAGLDEDIDPQDLVVRAHVYNDGTENAEQGEYTPQLPMLLGSSVFWNGWLTLPLRIQDLSRDAQLVLTLWAPGELLVGGCRITLFDERLRLRSGAHRLVLWPRIRRPATRDDGSEGMTATEAAAEFLKGLHGVRAAIGETDDLDASVQVAAAVAAGDAAGPPVAEASLVPGVPVEMTPEAARATLAEQASEEDGATRGAASRGSRSSSDADGAAGEYAAPVSEGTAAVLPGDSAWEAERLVRAKAEFDAGEIPHLPWLDRLTMRQLAADQEAAEEEAEAVAEALEAAEEAALGRGPGPTPRGRAALAARRHPLCSFLTVEFPVLPFPVVFDSPAYADVAAPPSVQDGLVGPSALEEDSNAARWMGRLVTIFDPDAGLEHPVEAKVAKLGTSDARRGVDPGATPTPAERAAIDAVLHNPSIPARAITDLLWRYRHTLLRKPAAVVRFIDCVDWSDPEEVADATALPWALAPPEDVLRLLGPGYPHDVVRRYAIRCLSEASADEISLFMLQLVQAVRYEPGVRETVERNSMAKAAAMRGPPSTGGGATPGAALVEGLGELGPTPAPRDHGGEAGDDVDDEDADDGAAEGDVREAQTGRTPSHRSLATSAASGAGGGSPAAGAASAYAASVDGRASLPAEEDDVEISPLADLLVRRACTNLTVATQFHWFVCVEAENQAFGLVYNAMLASFMDQSERTPEGVRLMTEVSNHASYIRSVLSAVESVVSEPGLRADGKTANLIAAFSPGGAFSSQAELSSPVILPLDPRVRVCGLVAADSRVFKSSVSPARIRLVIHDSTDPGFIAERFGDDAARTLIGLRAARLRAEASARAAGLPLPAKFDSEAAIRAPGATRWTYDTLFKIGDDVRQDQLVLQLLDLMDRRFKQFGLDLSLTPYKVLATTTTTGVLEFVTGAMALDPIKRNILGWLKGHPGNADVDGMGGVRLDVIERYTRSCAGYCVWTYIMGIGDRHLDNILITPDGRLVHIDFGFAFGKDPKPLPPKVKLTKDMVEVMGGYYPKFLTKATRAFGFIRQKAGLYLDLLGLMRDSGLQSMADDPERAIAFVAEKLRLDMSEEDAELVLLGAIKDSVSAVFPLFVDFLHTVATQMR
ncbi:hypothetical protein FNF31_03962 [Cafeteria roenbergensis]|uniref:Phosphatidylinositol 3-kinase n=1 Tax=Cafeteria roenbergensis TaxID=33653 RepID=A0A5A8DB32_CAFRO|nr:hypothetical protein FNF31_03962 [Cafeteria roenbergensis]KAA0170864.1 hypothetical protein FNF28_01137 [Cafeteria roenbergensis]